LRRRARLFSWGVSGGGGISRHWSCPIVLRDEYWATTAASVALPLREKRQSDEHAQGTKDAHACCSASFARCGRLVHRQDGFTYSEHRDRQQRSTSREGFASQLRQDRVSHAHARPKRDGVRNEGADSLAHGVTTSTPFTTVTVTTAFVP